MIVVWDLIFAICDTNDQSEEYEGAWIEIELSKLPYGIRSRVCGNTVAISVGEYIELKSNESDRLSTMKWIKLEDDSSRTDKSAEEHSKRRSKKKKEMIQLLEAKHDLAQLELVQSVDSVGSTYVETSDCNGLSSAYSSVPLSASDITFSWNDVWSVPSDDIPFDLDYLGVDSLSSGVQFDLEALLVNSLSTSESWESDLERCVIDMDDIVKDEFVDPKMLVKS